MTGSKHMVERSQWLSWALRHDPKAAGISLDSAVWCNIDALLTAASGQGQELSRHELAQLVAGRHKQRFAIDENGGRIRANQGHSVTVELGLAPQVPPVDLFHGTAERFVAAILRDGLKRQARHHVHLSVHRTTATAVGVRHGRPMVLIVAAGRMHADGHPFYRSENGVWLADAVPAQYLGAET